MEYKLTAEDKEALEKIEARDYSDMVEACKRAKQLVRELGVAGAYNKAHSEYFTCQDRISQAWRWSMRDTAASWIEFARFWGDVRFIIFQAQQN